MRKIVFFLLACVVFSVTENISSSDNIILSENYIISSNEATTVNIDDASLVSNNQQIREPLNRISVDITTDIAIMIDFYTGDVIYEKNADKYWSAASLSKLFLIYQIMEKVEKGELNLDEYVVIDDMSWLKDMPADAALMFLEKGQRVTYRQLLQGLAIVSGNDAAYFVVKYLFGGKDEYARMVNEFFFKNGFDQMHMEEPSGLSGFNRITARQFAYFCRQYIDKYFPLLEDVHSLLSFTYPKKENFIEGNKYIYPTVTRDNSNLLLGKYEGADGLKTGFITISGYNLAVTAERKGERLIVILLGGKGKTLAQGRRTIADDAIKLLDKGFEVYNQ